MNKKLLLICALAFLCFSVPRVAAQDETGVDLPNGEGELELPVDQPQNPDDGEPQNPNDDNGSIIIDEEAVIEIPEEGAVDAIWCSLRGERVCSRLKEGLWKRRNVE